MTSIHTDGRQDQRKKKGNPLAKRPWRKPLEPPKSATEGSAWVRRYLIDLYDRRDGEAANWQLIAETAFKVAGDAGWQEGELGCSGLPDERLRQRLQRLFEQFSSPPGQPVPAARGDWAATKAAYRFFDNPRVTEHGVLAGHFAATAARCSVSEGPILLLQDTTEFIYNRARPDRIGFTRTINGGRYKAGQPNTVARRSG